MKTKKLIIKTRNKDYKQDGHARNKELLDLMKTLQDSVSIAMLAKKLGWWEVTVKASMDFLIAEGLVDVIEITRVQKEYVLLKERREM